MGNSYDEKRQYGRHTQVFQNARGGRPLGPPHTEFRTQGMHMQEAPPRGWNWRDDGERGFQQAMRIDRGGRYQMRGSNRYGTRDDVSWRPEDEDRVLMRGREWMETDRNLDEERQGMMQDAQFRGKGPKNYQRSDSRILEDVYDALTYQNDLDATDVEVSVTNAEVTLTGMVNSRHEKRMAEDLAHGVRGVHDVHNQLRIKRDDVKPEPAQQAKPGNGASNGKGANGQR